MGIFCHMTYGIHIIPLDFTIGTHSKDLLCKSVIRRNLEKVKSPLQWAPVEDMPRGVGCHMTENTQLII